MRRVFILLTTLAIVANLTISANALLISKNWKVIDDGLITRDTKTGLEWLGLTESDGLSFLDVSSNLGSDGNFEDFRYATSGEVFTLIQHAGITAIGTQSTEFISPATNLLSLVGITSEIDLPWRLESFAITAEYSIDSFGNKNHDLWNIEVFNEAELQTAWVQYWPSAWDEIDALGDIGHWLVRETAPVPEPGTMLLFGIGLVGLAGFGRGKFFKKF